MSIERIYYCDWPDCGGSLRTALVRPATGFLTVTEQWPGRRVTHHFCSWDCVLKYAGRKPPPEVFSVEGQC